METTMPAAHHLLERAMQFIDDKQLQNAEMLLDAVVRVEPQNVEAWMVYLQILKQQSRLDWVKERALKTRELSEGEKNDIVDCYLWQTLQIRQDSAASRDFNASGVDARTDHAVRSAQDEFQTMNVFGYSASHAEHCSSKRRSRAVYNIAADMIAGMVKSAMSHPLSVKAAPYLYSVKKLLVEVMKDPRRAYVRHSKTPGFTTVFNGVLALLFLSGVRLAASSYIIGYMLLFVFLVVGFRVMPQILGQYFTPIEPRMRVYMNKTEDAAAEVEKEHDKQD
ncbi:MAG: hypothetical protein IPG80_00205 [Anaerolineales bacterium]|uniref:hypothetical protein n=1 Tax=Candidatus Villigracilis vicinus TaxID=3140679 RepID=UPI003135DEB9|nr:hypothetical protein [Anaerolineales bacterium]